MYKMFINKERNTSNNTDGDFENNTMQTMQKFQETAKRQWELSVRKKTEIVKKTPEHTEPSSSDTGELYTWFPWLQENRPTIHTIKALAVIKKGNISNFPVAIGVGSWQEIILYGKKKDNSIEQSGASPLSNGSTSSVVSTLLWLEIATVMIVCFY